MVEILLSSIISCSDAHRIALKIQALEYLSITVKKELIIELEKASPEDCRLPGME
tara:strand:+ start:542 stop:706 length:165 start_codon:yes stop_codon:yes gene_type:complete